MDPKEIVDALGKKCCWVANPITIVHDQIWKIIDECNALKFVAKGNRVKFNSRHPNVKKGISPADAPQIKVLPDGFTGKLVSTSSSSDIKYVFNIVTVTDTLDHNLQLAQVQWALLVVAMKLKKEAPNIRYLSNQFLSGIEIVSGREGIARATNNNTKTAGWSSSFRIAVLMKFPKGWLCLDKECDELVTEPNFQPIAEGDETQWTGEWEGDPDDCIICAPTGPAVQHSIPIDLEPGCLYCVCVYVRNIDEQGTVEVALGGSDGSGQLLTKGFHSFNLVAGANNSLLTVLGSGVCLGWISVNAVTDGTT